MVETEAERVRVGPGVDAKPHRDGQGRTAAHWQLPTWQWGTGVTDWGRRGQICVTVQHRVQTVKHSVKHHLGQASSSDTDPFPRSLDTLEAFAILMSVVIGSGVSTWPGPIDTSVPSPEKRREKKKRKSLSPVPWASPPPSRRGPPPPFALFNALVLQQSTVPSTLYVLLGSTLQNLSSPESRASMGTRYLPSCVST